jgi:hypothetical protein
MHIPENHGRAAILRNGGAPRFYGWVLPPFKNKKDYHTNNISRLIYRIVL